VACALAGARNFREAGDRASDLPQGVLARLGGAPHSLRRAIIAPSETRIWTLVQAVGAGLLDDLAGGWLRGLADAGRLDEALTAVAIDGKWLRSVLDGQVKLFAAMLHQEKVIIGQVRVPDGTTEVTQAKALLGGVDLENAVVTAGAVHSCRETAQYIAGKQEDGGREADYLLFVKGNTPSLQRAAFDAVQQSGPGRAPGYTELDRSRSRVTRRSIWVADAGDIDFPQARRAVRIRRDVYDADGCLISKEIVHAVTSLSAKKAGAGALAGIARGQWGIESVHWVRDTAYAEDASTAYRGNGPQVMATLRNLAISLLYLAGVKEVTRTLQAIACDRNRMLDYLPL
jgi:predicted transposase YbfD/YdcC